MLVIVDWQSMTCIAFSTDYYQRLILESWFTNLQHSHLMAVNNYQHRTNYYQLEFCPLCLRINCQPQVANTCSKTGSKMIEQKSSLTPLRCRYVHGGNSLNKAQLLVNEMCKFNSQVWFLAWIVTGLPVWPSHKMGEGRHEGLVPRNDVLTNGFI